MNKAELAASVAEKTGISKKDAESAINAAMDTIGTALKNGDKVQLVGFGTFETKKRASYTGHDPRTMEPIEIKSARVPIFRAGKGLKDTVAE